MIKLSIKLLLALFSITILLCAINCDQKSNDKPPESLPWVEDHGLFYTRDIVRAQEEIPFPILLPTYTPDKRKNMPPPSIRGPLKKFQIKDDVEINILYEVYLELEIFGEEVSGIIWITETNHHLSFGDPELNPDLELIEVHNKRVIVSENIGKFERDTQFGYSFNHDNVYYIVEISVLTKDEAYKVVESMIKQLE
jgi:hypothetical protein